MGLVSLTSSRFAKRCQRPPDFVDVDIEDLLGSNSPEVNGLHEIVVIEIVSADFFRAIGWRPILFPEIDAVGLRSKNAFFMNRIFFKSLRG